MKRHDFARFLANTDAFMLEGQPIHNLNELSDAVDSMDDRVFRKHCNDEKNDFCNWILHSLGDERLARDIQNIRHKANMAGILKDRIAQLRDFVRHPQNAYISKRIDMYVDTVEFLVDDQVCSNCEICSLVCPKEAVELKEGRKEVNDDCTKCGFCVHFCPLECIELNYNNEKHDFYTEHGMIPKMPECKKHKNARARQLFRGRWEVVGDCPAGCELCVQACPVNVLTRVENGKELKRVHNDREHCLLCGACKVACPYGLIESHRVHVRHEGDEYCNAWNRALEKLCRPEVKSAYHNHRNLSKMRKLIDKSGMRKY